MAKDDKTPEKKLSPEVEQLQEFYAVMLEKNLDTLELKDEELRVKLTRRFEVSSAPLALNHHAPPAASAKATGAPATSAPSETSSANAITAPLAGAFYRASSPTSAPFVKEGDSVDAGQTLCIVEAMKVMNEIKAETACRISKIVAENGRVVTAGQVLFLFEPV